MRAFIRQGRVLLLAAVAVMWAQAARAQTWDCGVVPGSVTATLNEDGTLTISGTGAMKDYSIEDEAPWFELRVAITNAVIVEGVTSIGDRAFYQTHLESITIPNGVTSIGAGAFLMTRLRFIDIPNSVTSIGNGAFNYSSLDSVSIGSGVISIGDGAFRMCSGLTSVTIPNNVTSIGKGAFESCEGLRSVTIGSGVVSIGGDVFWPCKNINTIFSLNPSPPALEGTGLNIPPIYRGNIFLYVPGGSIDSYKSADGWGDFQHIDSLENVEFGSKVWDCGKVPGTVTAVLNKEGTLRIRGQGEMRDYFYLVRAPWHIFNDAINSVITEDGVISIGNEAFFGCANLTSAAISNSVAAIGSDAFNGCTNLTAIEVSSGNAVYSSENGVLLNKNKTTLIQYPSGKQDASYAIPESVTSIEGDAFSGCAGLTTITVSDTVPIVINETTFYSINGTDAHLYVPDGSVEAYHAANGWRYFAYINDEYVGSVSVAARDRVIPAANPVNETAVIAPAAKFTAEFAAGPNPASRSSGAVKFYYQGKRVKSGALTVYDASGSAVNKIIIRDDAVVAVGNGKRVVGLWNLTDKKGRLVPTGTYLVRGTITASNGKSEKVSATVGVR